MPGRQYSSNSYRYGFNGKEKDDEINVNGGEYNFDARLYDSRLGRWLSVDPLQSKYADLSPYNFCANNSIFFIDPDGKQIIIHARNDKGVIMSSAIYKDGKLYQMDGKTLYTNNNGYILKVAKALDNLKKMDFRTNKVISDLEGADSNHEISNIDPKKRKQSTYYNTSNGKGGTFTKYDPYSENQPDGDNSPEDILGHELKHGWNKLKGFFKENKSQKSGNGTTNCEEVDAVNFENIIRDKEYKPKRTEYGGKEIPKQDLIEPNKYELSDNGKETIPNKEKSKEN